jgi:hypothetical protein
MLLGQQTMSTAAARPTGTWRAELRSGTTIEKSVTVKVT